MKPKLSIVDPRKHAEIYKVTGDLYKWNYIGYEVKKYLEENGIRSDETFERYVAGSVLIGYKEIILTLKLVPRGDEFFLVENFCNRIFNFNQRRFERVDSYCLKNSRKSALEFTNYDRTRVKEFLLESIAQI